MTNITEIEVVDDARSYRAEWTRDVETIVYPDVNDLEGKPRCRVRVGRRP